MAAAMTFSFTPCFRRLSVKAFFAVRVGILDRLERVEENRTRSVKGHSVLLAIAGCLPGIPDKPLFAIGRKDIHLHNVYTL